MAPLTLHASTLNAGGGGGGGHGHLRACDIYLSRTGSSIACALGPRRRYVAMQRAHHALRRRVRLCTCVCVVVCLRVVSGVHARTPMLCVSESARVCECVRSLGRARARVRAVAHLTVPAQCPPSARHSSRHSARHSARLFYVQSGPCACKKETSRGSVLLVFNRATSICV